jgi:hypothetical protein
MGEDKDELVTAQPQASIAQKKNFLVSVVLSVQIIAIEGNWHLGSVALDFGEARTALRKGRV